MEQDNSDIWNDDLLNRREDAEFLLTFLLARSVEYRERKVGQSYVLNLNAEWGQGKTFFLARFAELLQRSNHVVATVNAWRDDYADDPLLPVISEVSRAITFDHKLNGKTKATIKSLGKLAGQVVAAGAKGAIKTAGQRFFGEEFSNISKLVTEDTAKALEATSEEIGKTADRLYDEQAKALLETFEASQETIEKFKLNLSKISSQVEKEGKGPIFILIDELDRCRPSYAVKLLERIKHLFDLGGFIFVIATDTEQLQHAVGAIYGNRFDALRYLARFFNHTYRFEPSSKSALVADLMHQTQLNTKKISLPPNIQIELYISGACDFCGLSLRDVEQVQDMLATATTAWNLRIELEIAVLLPLVILNQQRLPITRLSAVPDQMAELHNKHKGDPDAWNIQFSRTEGYGVKTLENITGMQLLREFIARSETDLASIGTKTTSMHSQWAASRLQREFMQLHHNTHIQGQAPHSVIRRYPDLVRSAGRLVPMAPTILN